MKRHPVLGVLAIVLGAVGLAAAATIALFVWAVSSMGSNK